jgi:hypothetical protein
VANATASAAAVEALEKSEVAGESKQERPMLRKPIHVSAGEPSFFYLMMARSCFRRAASTRHPKAGGTLLEIGRDFLAKSTAVTSVLESESAQLPCSTAH